MNDRAMTVSNALLILLAPIGVMLTALRNDTGELMARDNELVGEICCRTDLATINSIATAGGLRVTQGRRPHLFRVLNSGRTTEPEVGEQLFEVFQEAMQRAATVGKIPSWSAVKKGN